MKHLNINHEKNNEGTHVDTINHEKIENGVAINGVAMTHLNNRG
jgi:hypothetical protein